MWVRVASWWLLQRTGLKLLVLSWSQALQCRAGGVERERNATS